MKSLELGQKYLSFERKLIANLHHPLNHDRPHFPVKMFLLFLDVVRLNQILLLSAVQINKRIIIKSRIDLLSLLLEFFYRLLEIYVFLFLFFPQCWTLRVNLGTIVHWIFVSSFIRLWRITCFFVNKLLSTLELKWVVVLF